eukprot:Hpha_TRINITY_DN751_c0_g1::TRINITY_DN751_c0_g1_i1::g.29003::m.29003
MGTREMPPRPAPGSGSRRSATPQRSTETSPGRGKAVLRSQSAPASDAGGDWRDQDGRLPPDRWDRLYRDWMEGAGAREEKIRRQLPRPEVFPFAPHISDRAKAIGARRSTTHTAPVWERLHQDYTERTARLHQKRKTEERQARAARIGGRSWRPQPRPARATRLGELATEASCPQGHLLRLCIGSPPTYQRAQCDVCLMKNLQWQGERYGHCTTCEYDVCGSCLRLFRKEERRSASRSPQPEESPRRASPLYSPRFESPSPGPPDVVVHHPQPVHNQRHGPPPIVSPVESVDLDQETAELACSTPTSDPTATSRLYLRAGQTVILSAEGIRRFEGRGHSVDKHLRPAELGKVVRVGRQPPGSSLHGELRLTATVLCPRELTHMYWQEELTPATMETLEQTVVRELERDKVFTLTPVVISPGES